MLEHLLLSPAKIIAYGDGPALLRDIGDEVYIDYPVVDGGGVFDELLAGGARLGAIGDLE